MTQAPLHFFCRLVPPRADFMTTMTDDERQAMRAHVAYWTERLATGEALLFGPVADPAGGYGIGILRVDDEAHLLALREADPAIQARIGFLYEVQPMPQVVIPPR